MSQNQNVTKMLDALKYAMVIIAESSHPHNEERNKAYAEIQEAIKTGERLATFGELKHYDMLSPDGFSINLEKVYSSPAEAVEEYDKWVKRFEKQGYYSHETERIPLAELHMHMQIVQVRLAPSDPDTFGGHWGLADIIHQGKEDGVLLTEGQAREIAEQIEKNHDASIGINWENISYHISDYCDENHIEMGDPIEDEDEEDLFANLEKVPEDVRDIVLRFSNDENDYERCNALKDALEQVGWTCEYDLDAVPFGLKKIETQQN
jgi:hypothetical protein